MELPYRLPLGGLWLISGLCFLLPFLDGRLWPLTILGISLWLLAIWQTKSLKHVALGSFIVGLGKYGGGIFWFWETYPVAGAVMLAAWKQWLMIGYFWIAISGSMAVGLSLVGVVTVFLLRSNKLVVFWPILFVLGEILSSFLFSIFTMGPGSYLNANFSFGYAGLPLAGLPVLFSMTAIFGLYGLSLFAAVCGLIVFQLFQSDEAKRGRLYMLSAGLLGLLLISYWLMPPRPIPTTSLKIIAVESKFSKNSFDDPDGLYQKRQALISAAKAAIELPSDIVLLPEDSRLTENTAAIPETLEALLEESPQTKLLVDSFRSEDIPNQAVLRAVYYDFEHATTTTLDKQYMVPIGEFVMNFEAWSLRMFAPAKVMERLTRNQNYVPGPRSRDLAQTAELPGILFCFENAAPLGVRQLASYQESSIVLHPISHGWFHDPDILWQNLDAMLRVQAIWSNKTIISAGNMSPSKVYYPDGTISTGKRIYETKYWSLVEYNL